MGIEKFDPALARQFAIDVVERLRAAGYEALWAGGCVRDQLLGITPKDYDVATNATPDEILALFGPRRTLAIGAAFGVMCVLGPRDAGQVEVATFRRDATYSDGRHPDSVTFSTAEEDAQRRDFTINGLFFDPIAAQVIDYVGGQEDLTKRLVRAIREPRERFQEDKLRMLRAIRFAATFAFTLDEATLIAIREQADDLVIVSAERIAAEMRRMLTHSNRALAMELLASANLLEIVVPEAKHRDSNTWQQTLAMLARLQQPAFATALAILIRALPHYGDLSFARTVGQRWRLANDETDLADWLIATEPLALAANTAPWPQVQRQLILHGAGELEKYTRAVGEAVHGTTAGADFIAAKLALPPEEMNPPPLVTGADLKRLGLMPGPQFKTILDRVRDAQLDAQVTTTDAALALARQLTQ